MMFSNFNRKPLQYKKPQDFFDEVEHEEVDGREQTVPVVVKDIWIGYTSEYRADKKSAVASLTGEHEGEAVNLPPHMIPVVEEILASEQAMQMLRKGKAGLIFYEYENNHGSFVTCDFVDIKTGFFGK